MADAKITQLNELAVAPAGSDILAIVDDPAGTPETKKITVTNLTAFLGLETTSTDNAVVRFDGTSGATQNSGIIIDDSDNITGVNQLDVDSANGVDVNPGSDIDADLITVGVTGTPTLSWDESQDSFKFSKGIEIDDNMAITFGTGFDASVLWDGTDLVLDYDSAAGGTTDFRIQENGTDRLTILTGGNVGIGITAPSQKLDVAASGAIGFAGTAILSDSAGTMTLSNVDALDATTATTIATGIDAATTTAQGGVELATTTETNTGTDTTRAVTPDGLSSAKKSIMLTASGGAPLTTAGCSDPTKVEAATNDINYYVLDFDATTEEHAFWAFTMPENWDGGTVNATFYWTNAAGLTTESVVWGIAGGCYADNAAIDTALGTEISTTDAWIAQGDMHISAESSDITFANAAAGAWTNVVVARKTGDASDDMTGDARLIAVKLTYTIDQYSDEI